MRSNSSANEVSIWTLMQLVDWEAAMTRPELRAGWSVRDDGALVLGSASGREARGEDVDLTGFEASETHIHLDPDPSEDEVATRLSLWRDAVALAVAGLISARDRVEGQVLGLVSLGGPGQGAVVRWHRQRVDEDWVVDDLEGYAAEAVLVLSTADLDGGSLRLARGVSAGLESNDPAVVSSALVHLALIRDDRAAIESMCWTAASHADQGVRDTAGLCLGHVGRRFGVVEDRSWELVLRLAADPATDGRPSDALEDLRRFAGR
jgi:hypothetical protein